MAISAYIAWLIVKFTFFLAVVFYSLLVMSNISVLSYEVANKLETMTEKCLTKPVFVLSIISIPCLIFLLGLWLFAPEYLP